MNFIPKNKALTSKR